MSDKDMLAYGYLTKDAKVRELEAELTDLHKRIKEAVGEMIHSEFYAVAGGTRPGIMADAIKILRKHGLIEEE